MFPRTLLSTRAAVLTLCAVAALTFSFLPGPTRAQTLPSASPPAATSRVAERVPAARLGAPYTLWAGATGHRAGSGQARTFGTVLKVRRSGVATALRYYAPGASGRSPGRLFRSSGELLVSARFPSGRHAGWRTAKLSTPVALKAGARYVVAYDSRRGASAPASHVPRTRGSLTATGGRSGAAGAFPTTRTASPQLADVTYRPRIGPFPTAANTGGPALSALSNYRGPCTITRRGTVIDHKLITCSLRVRAPGVVVRDSVLHGTISSGSNQRTDASFTLLRTTVDPSPNGDSLVTVVGDVHFKVLHSEIRGGNRGINCWYDCVVRRSWIHGQDTDHSGQSHESGVRMGQRGVIVENTLTCDAPDVPPDAGCSASLTGYGDFGPVRRNLISGNLFTPSTGGTCAYGGSSPGKPYSDGAASIRFVDNLFQRGPSGNCGYWAAIMSFDARRPGNVWVGNIWDSGRRVSP